MKRMVGRLKSIVWPGPTASNQSLRSKDVAQDKNAPKCRNCGAVLDYGAIKCDACGRKTVQFNLR